MEDIYEKSLRLQQEYLDNISNEDFLKKYNEISKQCNPNGITIDEYLKLRNKMKIENWSIMYDQYNPYQSPESRFSCISGEVYDHDHYEDGHSIITSKVEKIEDGCVYTHTGSIYELGEINRAYLKIFPNAIDLLV